MNYESILAPQVFRGTTTIVTGAGSGIGRCIAHEIASLGGRVAITGRTEEKLMTVQAEIVEDGGQVEMFAFDIRDEAAVIDAVQRIAEQHGRIDGLVNNAGGQFVAPLEDISASGFDAVVRNNLSGAFLMSREVFKHSMRDNGGAIVNMSADCLNGMPGMAHSGAARAGVDNLTKTAAWEWGPYGIRINSIAPGWILSSGLDTYPPEVQKKLAVISDWAPAKRHGTEAEVSAVVCFLLSPGASYINGATIPIDGASRLGSPHAVWPLPSEAFTESPVFNGFHRSNDPRG